MAELQKVIKGFECCLKLLCSKCPYKGPGKHCLQGIQEDALELLKKQEAVEPILKREGRNKYYNYYVCPCCDEEVVYDQNYCPECGAKFMWEGR